MSKFFVVNETVFLDLEPKMISDQEYHDYRLYKVMKKETGTDVHDDEEVLSELHLTEDLYVTYEQLKLGLIINNNVYLTYEQWHTIRLLDKDLYSCSVCHFQCDSMSVAAHMESNTHVRTLDGHKPLRRFDLSIIRKINENLHCAVCNTVFPITKYCDHENSKSHEGNLLFAINKVSDLMTSTAKKTTQTLNANNIREPNNAPNYTNNAPYHTNNAPNHTNNVPNHTNNVPNYTNNAPYHTNNAPNHTNNAPYYINNAHNHTNNAPNHKDIHRYTEINRNYQQVINDAVENRDFANTQNFWNNTRNFENNFKDIKIYEEEEIEEYMLPIQGVSYASMASKPRVNVPKFLKIDLGAKEVRVKYESWNMITQTELNQCYCMVCMISFLVRFKTHHCLTERHKQLLQKCAVVGAFEDYLIRNVSEKLYHCGHCNNLQYKNDMQIHVEKYHPMKNPKLINNHYPSTDNNTNIKATEMNMKATDMNMKATETMIQSNLDIFGEFKFSPFGIELSVSSLGCHALMLVNNRYHCALCAVYIQGELIQHVYEIVHMQFVYMTPFIRPFQCNLTRAIRGSLHCALCNILIPVTGIYDHNMTPLHTAALAKAMGMVKNKPPKHEVKYQLNKGEFTNELERFLATLPPASRELLRRYKFKNQKDEMFQLYEIGYSSSSSSYSTPTYMSVPDSPTHVNEQINQDTHTPELLYSKPGVSGINPIVQTQEPTLIPGQLLTLSMIESGLPGVRTGSPTTNFGLPMQLQITEPLDLTTNGVRAPVSPVRQPQIPDFPVRQPLVPHSPVRQPRVPDSSVRQPRVPDSPVRQPPVPDSSVRQPQIPDSPVRQPRVPDSPVKQPRVPVSPVRQPQDIEVSNELMSRYNQSPVRRAPVKNLEVKMEQSRKEKAEEKHPKPKLDTTQNSDEEEQAFILDETVLVKLKSLYFIVTQTSFHSLVHMGNGFRFCFVCSSSLDYCALQKHVESREHVDNMSKNKFLSNYCGQLFRQMYLMYHCAICNVTISRKELKSHLQWNIHIKKYEQACKKLNKKVLKELRTGSKEYSVETQKEFLYMNITEPAVKIVTYIQSANNDFEEAVVEHKLVKKSQMIILKGIVMKIHFESWHGLLTRGDSFKCIVCQRELLIAELTAHLRTESHVSRLRTVFDDHYYPALIRKINDKIVNCLMCNLELSNDASVVLEHISGRKHKRNYNSIIETAAHADSYSDCYQYAISL